MAGEWLKFDCSLPEKPEVLAITVALGWDDPDLTVGKLMRLFRWFDQHTVAGNAASVTPALLDRIIGVTGFVDAVAAVGWIVVEGGGISLHNFDRHNGATAKSRAQTAKRVANHKANAAGNGEGNAASVSGALPREEKRREEIPPTDVGGKAPRKRRAPTPDKPMASIEDLAQAGIPADVAAEFIAHKAEHKAPLTSRAWLDHLSESAKAGWTPLQAAEKVMARSWKGFEAKYVAGEQAPAARPTFAQQAADIARTTVPAKSGPDPTLARLKADDLITRPPKAEERLKLEEAIQRMRA